MIIHFIKFAHVLLAMGLLGLTTYCILFIGPKNQTINKTILLLSPFALLTGTLLVYPKHYTFHTPWIFAAYLFLSIFCMGIALILFLQKKAIPHWMLRGGYLILLAILIVIAHEAVRKTTGLPVGW